MLFFAQKTSTSTSTPSHAVYKTKRSSRSSTVSSTSSTSSASSTSSFSSSPSVVQRHPAASQETLVSYQTGLANVAEDLEDDNMAWGKTTRRKQSSRR